MERRRRPARVRSFGVPAPRSPATSPAQYPAASGIGVSVLLRQPHGFEGRSVVEKFLGSDTQALAHLKHRAKWRVNRDAAVRSPVDMSEDQHKGSDGTG